MTTRYYTYKRQVVLGAHQIVKFLKGKGYYAAIAAVVVIGGGVVGGTCACIVPTNSGGAAWTPITSANIKVATTGNDSTCTRHSTLTALASITDPCATWNKAASIANNGDKIAVMGGTYSSDGAGSAFTDSVKLWGTNSRTSSGGNAEFDCGDTNPVTIAGRYTYVESQYLTIQGKCFDLHKLIVGDYATGDFGSPSRACTDITVNNVSMWMFDVLGPCNNVTISNSNVGPSVACYPPGTGTSGQQCQANGTGSFGTLTYTGEQYFKDAGIGNNDCCTEPKVHDGGCDPPSCIGDVSPNGVTITGNQFYGFSSRDPDNGPHAGCLWIGYGNATPSWNTLTVSNNTFQQCMTYDVHIDFPGTPNLSFTGNTFTPPKDAIRTQTNFSTICTLPCGGNGYWVEIEVKCQNSQTITGYTITGNTFTGNSADAKGYDLDYGGCSPSSYSGTNISGNTLQNNAANNPAQPFSS